MLEKEYLEAVPVCVVTRAQSTSLRISTTNVKHDALTNVFAVEVSRSEDPPPVDLADTGFAKWCGVDQLPVLSRDTLIIEQKQDPTLSSLWEIATTFEEIVNTAEGFYLKDDFFVRKLEAPRPTCH